MARYRDCRTGEADHTIPGGHACMEVRQDDLPKIHSIGRPRSQQGEMDGARNKLGKGGENCVCPSPVAPCIDPKHQHPVEHGGGTIKQKAHAWLVPGRSPERLLSPPAFLAALFFHGTARGRRARHRG